MLCGSEQNVHFMTDAFWPKTKPGTKAPRIDPYLDVSNQLSLCLNFQVALKGQTQNQLKDKEQISELFGSSVALTDFNQKCVTNFILRAFVIFSQWEKKRTCITLIR